MSLVFFYWQTKNILEFECCKNCNRWHCCQLIDYDFEFYNSKTIIKLFCLKVSLKFGLTKIYTINVFNFFSRSIIGRQSHCLARFLALMICKIFFIYFMQCALKFSRWMFLVQIQIYSVPLCTLFKFDTFTNIRYYIFSDKSETFNVFYTSGLFGRTLLEWYYWIIVFQFKSYYCLSNYRVPLWPYGYNLCDRHSLSVTSSSKFCVLLSEAW